MSVWGLGRSAEILPWQRPQGICSPEAGLLLLGPTGCLARPRCCNSTRVSSTQVGGLGLVMEWTRVHYRHFLKCTCCVPGTEAGASFRKRHVEKLSVWLSGQVLQALVPRTGWPCAEEGIRDYGPSGRGPRPHPSPPKTPVAIGSLVLYVVVHPLGAAHGNPFPIASPLYFVFVPRSTNPQSATTCAKPATALGVLSVPSHMWKVSTAAQWAPA